MSALRALLLLAVLTPLLLACGNRPSRDNLEPPTELTPFTATANPVLVWTRQVGRGAGQAGVRLRLAYGQGSVFAASADGLVAAHEARSGQPQWSTRLPASPSGGPSFVAGRVIVGALDGSVHALDPADGSLLWSTQLTSEVLAGADGNRELIVVRSQDGRVSGVDARNGARRWVLSRDVPLLSLRGNSTPVVRGETVFVGFDTGRLMALDLRDGSVRWEQTIAAGEGRTELERMVDIDGELQVAAGDVYVVAYRGQAAALTTDGGRLLWSRDYSSFTGLALFGNQLFLTDADGGVWALDRRSGASLWGQDGLRHRAPTTPAAHGSLIAIADFEGYVHWLSSADGAFAARQRLGRAAVRTPPLVVDDMLYVLDVSGRLGAFRLGGSSG